MAIASWAIEEVRLGTIRLWHGLLANIPSGYALCDGSLGTPDLRDKFVKGAPVGQNPGSIGGSATHTHAEHAAQSHSGGAVGAIAASATAAVKIGTSAASAADKSHNHPAPSFTQPSAHPALSHDSPNSEPSYYTVAYIMKV